MRIERIEYRQLKTFGHYENETVGATALVQEGESAEEAMDALKKWVHNELHLSDAGRSQRSELQRDIYDKECELAQLNDKIDTLKGVWERAKGFLIKHGLDPEQYEPIPF